MSVTKLKFCGMMRPEDILCVNELRPDFCGFILAEGFRRSIEKRQAEEFRKLLDPEIPAVGVFVNDPCEKVISYLEEGVIQAAQLHGDETEEEIRYIRAVTGKPVIKAVKASERRKIEAWLDSEADYLLFDSGTGTGRTFDWELLRGIDREYFLAGGLSSENLSEALSVLQPYAVDLSSGIETDGRKDPEKMRLVAQIVRAGAR